MPGLRHGESGTLLYRVWQSMKQRCRNTKDKFYYRYGGRGIAFCEEWSTYENFRDWAIGTGYKQGLNIDRINNDGNYSPDNCHWVDDFQSARNHSKVIVTVQQVKDIKYLHKRHWIMRDVAWAFGIPEWVVYGIASGETFRNVEADNGPGFMQG